MVNDTNILINAIHSSVYWIQWVVGGVFGIALIAFIVRTVNEIRISTMLKRMRRDLTHVKVKVDSLEKKWNLRKR